MRPSNEKTSSLSLKPPLRHDQYMSIGACASTLNVLPCSRGWVSSVPSAMSKGMLSSIGVAAKPGARSASEERRTDDSPHRQKSPNETFFLSGTRTSTPRTRAPLHKRHKTTIPAKHMTMTLRLVVRFSPCECISQAPSLMCESTRKEMQCISLQLHQQI